MSEVEYAYELLGSAVDAGLEAFDNRGYHIGLTWQLIELTAYRWANTQLLNEEYQEAAYG